MKSVYKYGLLKILMRSFYFFLTFLISLLLRVPHLCILFSVGFSFLRSYYDGYHAKSRKSCLLLTAMILFFSIAIIENYIAGYPWIISLRILLWISCGSMILLKLIRIIRFKSKKEVKQLAAFLLLTLGFLLLFYLFFFYHQVKLMAAICFPYFITFVLYIMKLIEDFMTEKRGTQSTTDR